MGRVIKVTILDSGILQIVPQNAFSGENNAVQLNCYCSDALKDYTKYIDFESNGVKYRSPAFTDGLANFVFNIPNIISNYNTLFQFVFIEGDKIIKTQKGTIYVQESVNAADQITFESGDILNDFETRITLVEGKVDDFLINFSVDAGTVSTLPAGSNATVTKTGDNIDAIFNFGIPQGIQGIKGDTGSNLTFGTSWTTALPITPVTNVVYPFAGTNATLIGGITWYNGDFAQYNGTSWLRIPFQSLANYYLKTEIYALLLPIIQKSNNLFIIPLISTGNGAGVSTLQLIVNATTTIYIDGAGKFYDDAAGTINEGTTRTLTSGAIRTVYLKVTSGVCNITCVNGNTQITQFNGWTSSTNAASINLLNLSSLPSVMNTFNCQGSNTITGNLSSLPAGITYFNCQGSNTITGNLSSLPSVMNTFNCQGSNTITGNLSSLPSVMNTFNCQGSNTITGNLSSLPAGITYFYCTGSNTITGNLSSLPAVMTFFYCTGSNTITGNLSSLPAGMTYFTCIGSNTIADYTAGKDWANLMNYFRLDPSTGGGLDATEIDNLIIDLDNGNTWGGSGKTLYIKGTNAAPTATSLVARNSLISKGVTITTN